MNKNCLLPVENMPLDMGRRDCIGTSSFQSATPPSYTQPITAVSRSFFYFFSMVIDIQWRWVVCELKCNLRRIGNFLNTIDEFFPDGF